MHWNGPVKQIVSRGLAGTTYVHDCARRANAIARATAHRLRLIGRRAIAASAAVELPLRVRLVQLLQLAHAVVEAA